MAGSEPTSHEWAKDYEAAMRRLREHVKQAQDGTFYLDIRNGREIDIDPIIYADLARSLERTNQMIRNHEIDPQDVIV